MKIRINQGDGRLWWEWLEEANRSSSAAALEKFKEAFRLSYFDEYDPPCEAIASRDPGQVSA